MKALIRSALAVVLFGALTVSVPARTLAAEPDDAIKYRKAVMEIVGSHTHAIFAIMQGKVPHGAALAYHADGLAAATAYTKDAFTQNTAGQGKEETTAKAEIWQGPEFFERLEGLATNAGKLASAIKAGDGGAIGLAAKDLGESCKGCHDKFRDEHDH